AILDQEIHRMQRSLSPNPHHRLRFPRPFGRSLALLTAAFCLSVGAGCDGDAAKTTTAEPKPFAGTSLTLRCADPAFADAITPAARSWAERTGATVAVRHEAMAAGDDSDIGIIAAPELGAWADRGELAAVPAGVRASDHPFQWTGVLPAYREQVIE